MPRKPELHPCCQCGAPTNTYRKWGTVNSIWQGEGWYCRPCAMKKEDELFYRD